MKNLFLALSLLIVPFCSAIYLPGDTIDPASLLGSFDLKDDLLGRARTRTYSQVDAALDELAGVVDWLSGLHHHVAVLVLRSGVYVAHIKYNTLPKIYQFS